MMLLPSLTEYREFVRKKEKSNINAVDLFAVSDKDIENELQSIIKNTQRIEKNVQRLVEEEKRLIEEEDRWATELEKLVCDTKRNIFTHCPKEQTSRTTIERLEEKTRKEQFEWTREQKIEEAKLERLLQRLDNLERYVVGCSRSKLLTVSWTPRLRRERRKNVQCWTN